MHLVGVTAIYRDPVSPANSQAGEVGTPLPTQMRFLLPKIVTCSNYQLNCFQNENYKIKRKNMGSVSSVWGRENVSTFVIGLSCH